MLAIVATTLGLSLAFSSMLLSWYILMPHNRKVRRGNPVVAPKKG